MFLPLIGVICDFLDDFVRFHELVNGILIVWPGVLVIGGLRVGYLV